LIPTVFHLTIMFKGFEDLIILILLLLWTLPWKGVALWRASKREEKKWFVALLVLNTLAVLEILYIFIFSKRPPKQSAEDSTRRAGEPAKGPTEERGKPSGQNLPPPTKKEEAKSKLLASITSRGRIANNDVQLLLNVSDATATNYLEELEKEGKIKQHGKIGRGVFYTLK